jgi:hypothetical protein
VGKKAYLVTNCAVLILIVLIGWYLWRTHSIGHLQVTTVVPAMGVPEAVAISPDGYSVAMMYEDTTTTTDAIEVHDIRSGRVQSYLFPQGRVGSSVSPPISYCDGGKYLVAYDGPGTLYVIDTRNLQLHTSIDAWSLPKQTASNGEDILLSCSAESSLAVLADGNSNGAVMLALLDLESGKQIADLSNTIKGRHQGDGIAISPNGTQLAVATWIFGQGRGSTLELISIPEKRSVGAFDLERQILSMDRRSFVVPTRHQLSFAGEHTVMVGGLGCDDQGETCLPNAGHRFRVIDLSGAAADRALAQPGMEAYRFSGASADGDVLFGYTGAESRCTSCNSGLGEIKISNARFTVWDRNSARVIAQSPSLHVQVHSCWLNIGLGACTSYERPPQLQMSANGKAVLAFWPPLDYADAKPRDAKVEVFSRR